MEKGEMRTQIDGKVLLSINVSMIFGTLFFLSLVSISSGDSAPSWEAKKARYQMAMAYINWATTIIIPLIISSILLIWDRGIRLSKVTTMIGFIVLAVFMVYTAYAYNLPGPLNIRTP
jgi:L-cystine uptake protein TcyP (sodium:dicarboxylate symporter family)